jgi:hypothetical protein
VERRETPQSRECKKVTLTEAWNNMKSSRKTAESARNDSKLTLPNFSVEKHLPVQMESALIVDRWSKLSDITKNKILELLDG